MSRAIVLGAGRSLRMGAPKLLTRIHGEPAVVRIVRELRAAGIDDITIVAPLDVELPDPGAARVVRNPDPDAGRTGSLQLGLPADACEVIVWPVDHPLARAATLRALLAVPWVGIQWVLPTHLGRSGHPILIRGERALDAIRHAAAATPLRAIPPTLGVVPTRVAVDDAGVLANLDTPEQVEAATEPPVRLVAWGRGDFALLERLLGDPAMMGHLGGPESPAKLRERQARYERKEDPALGRTLKVELATTGEGVGWVGYWSHPWRGEDVFEIGWSVLPAFQGRGIATRATAQALELARSDAKSCRFVHAMPAVENLASNAVCRKLGFELVGPCDVEYPPGRAMRVNDWRFDLVRRQAI